MKSSGVKRSDRVAAELHEELAMAVGALNDPRLLGARVTRVALTDDLRFARVYVRLEAGDSPASRSALLRGLGSAAGKLRGEVTRAIGLRFAPELRFHYDEGVEAASRVDELLREIEQERGKGSE